MARTPRTRGGKVTAFSSDLGWVAAYWVDELLARLTFGHDSPQAAVKYMAVDAEPIESIPRSDELAKRLQAFAGGDRSDGFLDIPLFLSDMTAFQQAVIERCRRIPAGQTLTYGELARETGHAGAARAVGRVMATNRFPLIVPCHRVVAAGGAIGGFSAPDGINMKRRLLAPEAAILQSE